jgi:putative spermidine/putrescine transport system permease protein
VRLIVAIPPAALMQANETCRRLVGTLYKIPLVVPRIVAGFLVMIILDPCGMATRLATPLGVALSRLVRDPLALGAMAAISEDVLAAARTRGAAPATVLMRIQLPLAHPGITAAELLSIIRSIGSYVIPSLRGRSTRCR